ncbi:MAG: hypothetical protein H7318_10630 [Oligoflexus sp.]|nr:hypothetical protein [Oligoflexus sp.]
MLKLAEDDDFVGLVASGNGSKIQLLKIDYRSIMLSFVCYATPLAFILRQKLEST